MQSDDRIFIAIACLWAVFALLAWHVVKYAELEWLLSNEKRASLMLARALMETLEEVTPRSPDRSRSAPE